MNSENIKYKEPIKNVINDEHILVVKRDILLGSCEPWQGLKKVSLAHYLEIIDKNKDFLPRNQMELNPTYKQIIPYLVFEHNGKYFLMQRQAKASEQRLKNKYSFGIGGHIRQEDIQNQNIIDWSKREFHEEIDYQDSFEVECLGILNDDSNAVGQVHVGFVFLLKGNSANIKIKSELQNGNLLSLEECESYYPSMESWSQIVFNFLKAGNCNK